MTNWARHGIVLVIAVAFAGYQYSKTVNHLSKREEALTRQTSRAKGLVARNIDMVEYELLDVTSSNKAAHTLIVNRAAVPPLIVAEISPVGFLFFIWIMTEFSTLINRYLIELINVRTTLRIDG